MFMINQYLDQVVSTFQLMLAFCKGGFNHQEFLSIFPSLAL